MNFQSILESIARDVAPLTREGAVASYIPALARVPQEQFGIALRTVDAHRRHESHCPR